VEPVGSGLVPGVASVSNMDNQWGLSGSGEEVEQALDLGDGERDEFVNGRTLAEVLGPL
jgi:hypothetical protein